DVGRGVAAFGAVGVVLADFPRAAGPEAERVVDRVAGARARVLAEADDLALAGRHGEGDRAARDDLLLADRSCVEAVAAAAGLLQRRTGCGGLDQRGPDD